MSADSIHSDEDREIYVLGLDFGTAFTKCIARSLRNESTSWPVEFMINGRTRYFIDSVLRVRGSMKKSPFETSMDDEKTIHFLKMRLLGKTSASADLWSDGSTREEAIADAAYFLSHVIANARDYMSKLSKRIGKSFDGSSGGELYINMCMPVAVQDQPTQEIFLKVLHVAYAVNQGRCESQQLPTYDEILSCVGNPLSYADAASFCTCYPETSANLQSFLKSPARQDGYYALVDVGGGTVDVTLLEYNSRRKTPLWYYHSEVICEGSSQMEMRLKSIFPRFPMHKLRHFKEGKGLPDNVAAENLRLSLDKVIQEIHDRVGRAMGSCIEESFKRFGYADIRRQKDQIRGMRFFFCGNGMCSNPYEHAVRFFHRAWGWIPDPDSVPFQAPRDLQINPSIDGDGGSVFQRLTVAYGMSFMADNLSDCIYPKQIPLRPNNGRELSSYNPASDYEEN
jgi:hypothetical protein